MSQSTSQSSAPSNAAPANRGDLLVSGLFSDFTIVCHGERIPVHRSILYEQSSFFKSALTVDMKEKETGVMELPEAIIVIEALLSYLYSGDYTPPASKALPLHAGVYVAALKYDIPGFHSLAGTKFGHSIKELTNAALLDSGVELVGMEELSIAAQIVFDGTLQIDDKLRMNLIETAWRVVTQLERSDPRHTFVDQIMQVPDFAAEILYRSTKAVAITEQRQEARVTLQCPHCPHNRLVIARSIFQYKQMHARPLACPFCLRVRSAREWTEQQIRACHFRSGSPWGSKAPPTIRHDRDNCKCNVLMAR